MQIKLLAWAARLTIEKEQIAKACGIFEWMYTAKPIQVKLDGFFY